MNLWISALAGVSVACLIFIIAAIAPWSALLVPSSSLTPVVDKIPPPSPVTVRFSMSNFTEPKGPGSEANLTVTITSTANLSNVIISLSISKADALWSSKGIEFDTLGGDIFRAVNLTAGSPITFSLKVKAVEVGYGRIYATARWNGSGQVTVKLDGSDQPWDVLGIAIYGKEILVLEDYLGVLPPLFPPGFKWEPPESWKNWTIPYLDEPTPYP